jgi:hypothetical protein
MNRDTKPITPLFVGALLLALSGGEKIQAQSTLVESGTSYLTDIFNSPTTSPETLSVSWFVVENNSTSVFTYGYNLFNPTGDVALNNNGTPTSIPEVVNSFTVSFPVPTSAFFQATPPAGGSVINNGANGITFVFPDVSPGNYSPLLAFQTTVGPVNGNASAGGGAVPPGPWSNVPDNSPVPVPRVIPEPGTTALLGLGLMAFPFRALRRRSS